MNTAGVIYFAFCALVALLGAVGVVAARDPIRSAVALLAAVLGIAGFYLKLHAEFLAAIQIIVYAGAVVVLFVFVIMLLGPDAGARAEAGRARGSRAIGAVLAAMLGIAGILLMATSAAGIRPFAPAGVGFGSVEAVGGQLFTKALVPFELATALLIVAVVGAIAISRGRSVLHPGAPPPKNPTARLFGGPVGTRDADRAPAAKETP